mmetsp:Transcript_2912/g.8695  ORF Transcript_2912/g.8695 Transcript_2912/m.8695 type:complete len:229 (+) Transcript_2912:867-1553(+)
MLPVCGGQRLDVPHVLDQGAVGTRAEDDRRLNPRVDELGAYEGRHAVVHQRWDHRIDAGLGELVAERLNNVHAKQPRAPEPLCPHDLLAVVDVILPTGETIAEADHRHCFTGEARREALDDPRQQLAVVGVVARLRDGPLAPPHVRRRARPDHDARDPQAGAAEVDREVATRGGRGQLVGETVDERGEHQQRVLGGAFFGPQAASHLVRDGSGGGEERGRGDEGEQRG